MGYLLAFIFLNSILTLVAIGASRLFFKKKITFLNTFFIIGIIYTIISIYASSELKQIEYDYFHQSYSYDELESFHQKQDKYEKQIGMSHILLITLSILFPLTSLLKKERYPSDPIETKLRTAYDKGLITKEELEQKLAERERQKAEEKQKEEQKRKKLEDQRILNQKLEELENLYKENLLTKEEYEQKITKLKNQS